MEDTSSGSAGLRVLVVDDERAIAHSLALILRNAGFSATAALGGESALEIAEEFRPDFLITDVAMPGMDGFALARAMVARYPKCRIFLFSGHAWATDYLRPYLDEGYPFAFIPKPIHPDDLIARLQAVSPDGRGSGWKRAATSDTLSDGEPTS